MLSQSNEVSNESICFFAGILMHVSYFPAMLREGVAKGLKRVTRPRKGGFGEEERGVEGEGPCAQQKLRTRYFPSLGKLFPRKMRNENTMTVQ